MEATVVIILTLIAAALLGHHGHHVRRNRRAGFGLWYSLRGPWGTRWTISKRF
jgi:hypothetical protein